MIFPLKAFTRFLPIPVQGLQELEMTCVFNNAESMSFHELGQYSFSGKDSTVKEQLLLVCSAVKGRRESWDCGTCSAFCSKFFLNARQCWKENSAHF